VRLLLDTHIFLWFITDDERLPWRWRETIADEANDVCLSVISVWESIIKHQSGKLPLPQPPEMYLATQRVAHKMHSLELDEAAVCLLPSLPLLHRDPFDRMLLCQARAHDLTLVSSDRVFHAYGVRLLDQLELFLLNRHDACAERGGEEGRRRLQRSNFYFHK